MNTMAASNVDVPGWMRTLSRVGFGAKGVVYLILGYLAIRGGASASKDAALTTIVTQPFGRVLLSVVALGLACYALWRLVSGAIDPHDKTDDDAKGIGKRIGYLASGIAYAALAFTAARIVLGARQTSEDSGAQDWTGTLLQMSFGQWLVAAVAAGVLIGAAYQLKQAWTTDFTQQLRVAQMSATELDWATRLGRIGHAARALVYALIAYFLGSAALADEASRAGGLSKALNTVAAQPYGPWLLGGVGLGFAAYGVYCLAVARYRSAAD